MDPFGTTIGNVLVKLVVFNVNFELPPVVKLIVSAVEEYIPVLESPEMNTKVLLPIQSVAKMALLN